MRNKNLHITAILFVIFIIATMIVSSKFKSSLNPSNLFSQFQKNFYTEKKIFSDDFSTLIDSLSSNLVSHQNKLHSFSNANPQNFSFFIYKDDSLIFWSNNEITPPKSYISTNGFSVVKLQNGYYQYLNNVVSNYKIVALNLIKHKYSFNNIYLSNSFKASYNLPAEIEINSFKGKYDFNLNGKFVFSLSFPSSLHLPRDKILILFAFYYLLFVLLIIFIYQLYATYKHLIKNKILFVILFSVDVIILRFIISYFKIPQVLFSSFLFSPYDFSFSLFFNSLGDLFLNATAIIAISLFVYKYLDIGQKKTNRKPFSVFFKIFTVFLHFYIFYSLIYALQASIILDSNFSLDLTNIFDLSLSSYIAMFSLSIILLSYFLIAIKLFHHVFSYFSDNKFLFISALIVSFLLSLLYFYFRSKTTAAFLPVVFILVLFAFRKHYNSITGFYNIVIYILLFAAFTSYIFTRLNTIKMYEDKKILAINLSNSDDPLCEYAFSLSYKQITTDSTIINFLTKSILKLEYEDSASAYLEKKYLNRIFPNYSTFTTVCSQDKILDIQPENYLVPCKEHFRNLLSGFTDTTKYYGLYINNLNESSNLIIEIPFDVKTDNAIFRFTIFSELFLKNIPDEGLGYPELLVDANISNIPMLGPYSYARYKDDELVYKFGKYFYSLNLNSYKPVTSEESFYKNDFKHFYYKINNSNSLIISSKKIGFLDIISSFSFLLVFFFTIAILFFIIFIFPFRFHELEINFRSKLQISIISIILFVFILIGTISVSYIVSLNNDKNSDILKEKTHSVLIELEHKLLNEPTLGPEMNLYLSNLLNKFSLVFFSDINLYGLDGKLIASSRPQVFEQALISTYMNPMAFQKLSTDKKLLYLHRESLGSYQYLSAYTPFRNSQNHIVAYLNLPYFARQGELQQEISTFLSTFINIYILFVAIAIIISLIISRYITRPLMLLQDKLSHLKFGDTNEKIEWKGTDEIGKLVFEYNKMIDELGKSADLLAKSERESAWREMAKQVAHEIKNPLTPMKLSVQYLEKAWHEKAPDWDDRLKRFTRTIIEQIESLSMIASEFSDFAKMPTAKIEEFDLVEILNNSIELYKDYQNIQFKFDYNNSNSHLVLVDKKQLLRAFNNLIKNAVQAIGDTNQGEISISLSSDDIYYVISFSDNGPGIPEELSEKIFSPSFTTKSSGMGLGLAIVESIVLSYGGKISFHSEMGKGTTFYINLPVN